MPGRGSTSTTESPAAGLPVVLSVTVPVNCAACANAPEKRKLATAACKKVFIDIWVFLGFFYLLISMPAAADVPFPPATARSRSQVVRAAPGNLLQDISRHDIQNSDRADSHKADPCALGDIRAASSAAGSQTHSPARRYRETAPSPSSIQVSIQEFRS